MRHQQKNKKRKSSYRHEKNTPKLFPFSFFVNFGIFLPRQPRPVLKTKKKKKKENRTLSSPSYYRQNKKQP